MHDSRACVFFVLSLRLFGFRPVSLAATEVWLSSHNFPWHEGDAWIGRATAEEDLLPQLNVAVPARDLTVIADEVWFSAGTSNFIHRVTLDGTVLPDYGVGMDLRALAVVPEPAMVALVGVWGELGMQTRGWGTREHR